MIDVVLKELNLSSLLKKFFNYIIPYFIHIFVHTEFKERKIKRRLIYIYENKMLITCSHRTKVRRESKMSLNHMKIGC